jgi:glycerophosphoryl diester phosphodiesterase
MLYTYGKATPLVRLAASALSRVLLIVTPFLALITLVYWLLVRVHDINFYLAQRPPSFTLAVAVAGLLIAVLTLLILSKAASWAIAIPLVLFEGSRGAEALSRSGAATRPHRRTLMWWTAAGLAAAGFGSALVSTIMGWLGGLVVSQLAGHLDLFIITLGLVIVLTVLATTLVSVLVNVVFALVVVRLYRVLAGPGELRPEISPRGSLPRVASLLIPGKGLVAAGIVAAVAALVATTVVVDDPNWHDPSQIIAHRGGAAAAPENTMAAFERAIADGAEWIELDVQENADGEVIVEHDSDFMRVAGRPLAVWKATGEDLADLDVGSVYDRAYANQRVPTLREVLELAKGRIGVVIELKYYGHDVNLEQKVVDLVESADMASEIVIMSLNYEGIVKAKALRPDWTYGLLTAVAVGDLTGLDVDFLAITGKQATWRTIRRAHRRGQKVFAWTIDEPAQMWVVMSRGVDGVITDRVALAKSVKDMRAQVPAIGRIIVWFAGEVGLLRGVDAASVEEDI